MAKIFASEEHDPLALVITHLNKLEILEYEVDSPVELESVSLGNQPYYFPSDVVTITIKCRRKGDIIKQLKEQNKELKDKLVKLNEILNPDEDRIFLEKNQ